METYLNIYMHCFVIIWIYIFQDGVTNEVCDFELGIFFTVRLKCEESPTADDIIQTMKNLENKNISRITSLVMASCNITKLNVGTFDLHRFGQIETLRLEQNRITSLPETLFNSAALTDLEELNLGYNELNYVSPKHFAYLLNLSILYLDYNKFTTFEAGLFISNPLRYLRLDGNYIETLPDHFLAGNISITLKILMVNSNKVKEIPHCLLKTSAFEAFFPEIEVLSLGKNNIKELPKDWLNSTNWSFLRNLDLSFNQLETLPEEIFNSSYLRNLEKIDFSHNNITYLSEKLFQSPILQNLEEINFSHNNISYLPSKLFHSVSLQNLFVIDLSYNQINSLPPTFLKNQALENLIRISLNNNHIQSVSVDMLPVKLLNLCHFNLANNNISSIGEILPKVLRIMKHARGVLRKLCKLDLSNNSLTVQRTNFIQPDASESPFLINATLDLSDNNIGKFEVISLFPNRLESQGTPFITVPLKTRWLYISGNQPFSVNNLVQAALNIDLDQADPGFGISPYRFVKQLLRLHVLTQAFPYDYDCNCDMLKYLKLRNMSFFKKAMGMYKFRLFYITSWNKYYSLTSESLITQLRCGSPSHLYGKHLYQLKKIELQCEHSRCTDNETCRCIETPYNSTIRINCTETENNPMQVFHEQNFSKVEIYMGFNGMKEIPIANITISLHVILLDLSYNYITNIPSTFFSHYTHLTHLNLAGNCLTAIPSINEWTIINSLQVLEFRDNNFTCSCSGLQLKQTLGWLNARSKSIVKDLDQIKCSSPSAVKEKVIYQLQDPLFGCPFVNLVLILTLTLSLLLFFSLVIFIAYVFRYYIRLFLFIHFGWRFCYSYTKDETLYDAFISYSSKDSDWVIDQLMNPLENLDPPYNLCLHERDFLIGVPICDNISKATEGSKCTICVVSKNWLESDWCQFEFRVAHCLATVEKKARLLVILKEEIPRDLIKGDLKFYMKTFTYLNSAHPLFWSRLLNDLPRPDGENIHAREETELTKLLN